MAHRYRELIRVDVERTAPHGGVLRSFTWRGTRYPVVDVLGSWHLADRWWDPERHSDRQYHRVETPGHYVWEVDVWDAKTQENPLPRGSRVRIIMDVLPAKD